MSKYILFSTALQYKITYNLYQYLMLCQYYLLSWLDKFQIYIYVYIYSINLK